MELLENWLQPHSGATPLFSMRTESQASSLSCRSVDVFAWCKQGLSICMYVYMCVCVDMYNLMILYNHHPEKRLIDTCVVPLIASTYG